MVCESTGNKMVNLDDFSLVIREADQARSAGDYVAAERSLRLALKLQEFQLGLTHPEVAHTLNELGRVCCLLGRLAEAEFLYRRALGISRRTQDVDHPYLAMSLENLSNLYRSQGEFEKLARVAEGKSPRSGLPVTESPDEPESGDNAVALSDDDLSSSDQGKSRAEEPVTSAKNHSNLVFRKVFWLSALGVGLVVASFYFFSIGFVARFLDDSAVLVGDESEEAFRGIDDRTNAVLPDQTAVGNSSPPNLTEENSLADLSEADPIAEAPLISASASSLVQSGSSFVADARICSELVTRDANGRVLIDWHCDRVDNFVEPGEVFFYTRVRTQTSATVLHRWLRNDVIDQEIVLDIEANSGTGYRTYSLRNVLPVERGVWRVELWSQDGELFYVQEFQVG